MLLPGVARAEGEDGGGSEETSSAFFKYEDTDGGVSITGLNSGYPKALVIPAKIDGKTVVAIGYSAFYTSSITSVEIPSSVTAIGNSAFSWCESLTSVTFAAESQLTSIGQGAFMESGITSIEIPSSVTTIEGAAFNFCSSLTSVTFAAESQLTSIGQMAFMESGITSIEIPSSVTTIGEDAFRNNTALEYIAVSDEAAYNKYKDQVLGSDKLVVRSQETLSLFDESGFAFNIPTLYAKDAISYNRHLDTGEATQDQYATLCLPFALHLSQTNNLFDKVYVPMNTLIHNTAKSTPNQEHFVLMLEEQASDAIIPAGQPVFVKLQGGTENISLANHADAAFIAGFQPKTETMKVVDWDGASGLMTQNKQFAISYGSLFQPKADVTANDHIWSFNANGSFGPQREGVMPPFRLFLTVEENAPTVQAKAYSISIGVSDDSTTGIREIIPADAIGTSGSSKKYDGIIYDLNGRKVATADKVQSLPKGIYILNGKKMLVK